MSKSSMNGRPLNRRVDSMQSTSAGRNSGYFRRRQVTPQDAYFFSLKVAYLVYQLQPRAKRTQHVPAPAQAQKPSSSIHDLMNDFKLIRDSKSTRFPSKFMDALIQRLQDVMVGKEKSPEYNDATVKRTFATALNAFIEPGFKKRMEKDRRVEDLVLIFMSNASKELQKGKAPGDKSWQMMADRHVALFLRLISRILKEHDWAKDRPELASRLTTLEQKLLANDQDLSSGAGTQTIEVLVPLSNLIKDMPLAQVVARVFEKSWDTVQYDINAHKADWTPQAALKDIKTYQTLLNLNSPKTLRSDDFDIEEAYDAWKRGEAPDLSQMILAIVQSYPELAKVTSVHNQANFNLVPVKPDTMNSTPVDLSRQILAEPENPYLLHQPVDMSLVSPTTEAPQTDAEAEDHTFTFIPHDTRAYYKAVLSACLSHDLKDHQLQETEGPSLLSKHSTELLNELCLRWRIPYVSRITLFLDAMRDKFLNNEMSLDQLDKAFQFVKEPLPQKGKDVNVFSEMMADRTRWTMADFTLYQQVFNALHTSLLRDLLEVLLRTYEAKAPSPGPLLLVIDEHIESDPYFSQSQSSQEEFTQALQDGLRERAQEMYRSFLEKKLPRDKESWEFYHVIELGKAVTNLSSRIQKKFRKNPVIMGANPLVLLLQIMLPDFAQDARDIVGKIMEVAQQNGMEPPIEDGFELYKELVQIRDIHSDALPDVPFAFGIEDLLQSFVWRWIKLTEEKTSEWVDAAVQQDDFQVRCPEGEEPSEEQRHSVSVIDLFTFFRQPFDRIAHLNWDDDLQYAKFMTAMSKIMGIGIARYCELLSQKFAEEMDRLTPEQEAAANQSRQEKYWQMAKDAWSQKERIQPFNFYPTSFVKLNDIEYATKHLDIIEKEMNVDACVDVINRNAPPTMQKRKLVKNVFTIKIVEAEDLKACDVNGLSDPYVVLGDEYQKRLAKTRIIYANLNPRWDETVDITTTGPLNIIATVWDWDTLGDHDCCGRTSIKLDPSNFADFLPKEYWLDLDTQGRLLLRVNMEGERDDIEFYYGKTFRTLKRTERDMTRKITDKLSSYINYVLSRRTLKNLTSKGISSQLSAVSGFFARNAIKMNMPTAAPVAPTQEQIQGALTPLFNYFDDNFAIMKETLTQASMISVMSRLWKEVLSTVEALCVPPLSDKPSLQKPLTQQELDIVFRWLDDLYEFFAAVDQETGEVMGVPHDVLRSPKYFDVKNLNFFYFEATDELIRTSERIADATADRIQGAKSPNRLSAPPQLSAYGTTGGLLAVPSSAGRRSKSVLLSRNLGTMKRAKEEKRKEAQAEPSDDMILRILRMRPEAQKYLKDRDRQKVRLAAAAAAQQIVKMSLKQGGGGQMARKLPVRR